MKSSEDNSNTLPEPKITEDRSYDKKSPKAILGDLQKKSFAQEIENDKEKSAVLLNRAKQAEAILPPGDPVIKQEQMSVDVYKRALALIGSGGLQINGNAGEKQSAADNNLPVSSYLSHGARVMIEIPPGSGDTLANWLTSGDPDKSGMSRKQSQQGAIDEDKIVYNRSAATHDVSIKEKVNDKGEKEFSLKEEKGFTIGLRDFVGNQFGMKTNHWGVDLAMNAEFGGKDSEGKIVGRPDGDHGHLYIHYNPPKDGKPGTMLIGIEGGAPTSHKHSKTGASDPLSPVDSSKFDDVKIKKDIAGEKEYENTIVPKKYGGMVVKLDQEKLNDIVKINAKDLDGGLAYVKPGTSPKDFKDKLENKDYHQTPEFKESKKQEPTLEKPSMWKKIANVVTKVVTLGMVKPFQKEIDAYNAEHKTLKTQAKVQANDGVRISEQQEKSTKVGISNPDLTMDKTKTRSNSIDSISTAASLGERLRSGSQSPPGNNKVEKVDKTVEKVEKKESSYVR
jgi:hypothetical protein